LPCPSAYSSDRGRRFQSIVDSAGETAADAAGFARVSTMSCVGAGF
jgi:hypothetical protein